MFLDRNGKWLSICWVPFIQTVDDERNLVCYNCLLFPQLQLYPHKHSSFIVQSPQWKQYQDRMVRQTTVFMNQPSLPNFCPPFWLKENLCSLPDNIVQQIHQEKDSLVSGYTSGDTWHFRIIDWVGGWMDERVKRLEKCHPTNRDRLKCFVPLMDHRYGHSSTAFLLDFLGFDLD